MSLQYKIYGAVMLVGSVAYLLYRPITIIQRHRRMPLGPTRHRYDWLQFGFMTLLCLYPLGNGLKFLIIGPDSVRFHMADIGFPVFLAWAISKPLSLRLTRENLRISEYEQRFTPVYSRLFLVALVLSYAYEVVTGYAHATASERLQGSLVGAFDWWDIVSYSVGVCAGYVIVQKRLTAAKQLEAERLAY